MLILNVFQSLVSAADKMSKVKINFPSGYLPLQLLLHFVFHIIYYPTHNTHCLRFYLLRTDPGTLRSETTLSDTDRKDEGISLVDVSKHGKPVDECSAYKANKKKHTELLDAEVK